MPENNKLNWGPKDKAERQKLYNTSGGEAPDMILTLKDDKDFIDGISNWSAVSGADRVNINFNDQIKKGLYSGKYGYNPKTGQLINLAKANAAEKQTTLAEGEKKYLRSREDVPFAEAEKEWNKDRVPVQIERGDTAWNPDFEFEGLGGKKNTKDLGGQTVYMTPEEAEEYNKKALYSSMVATQNNPIWHLPGTIASFGATGATGATGKGLLRKFLTSADEGLASSMRDVQGVVKVTTKPVNKILKPLASSIKKL